MKKILIIVLSMFLFNSVLISSPASAAQNVKISEPTHRLSSGVFIDDQFASKLLPDGEIGSLIYKPYRGVRNWFIDPATIEEIIAMSAGYGVINGVAPAGQEIAKNWLAQLNKVTRFEKVNVLSYGNPSDYWLKELAPEQIEYINLIGKASLDLSLSRNSLISTLVNEKRQKLSKYELSVFRYAQRQIDLLSTLVNKKELDPVQLRLTQLLNSDIEKSKFDVLIKDFNELITIYRSKIKVTDTKFTITSQKQELPVTVVNDFKSPVNVKLSTRALNGKVKVGAVEDIEILGEEKRQVLLPVEVLASGNSSLLLQLTNLDNKPVGYPVNISLNLSVISPIATWITTGAAVLLFIAAMVQSWRRVRRRKNV